MISDSDLFPPARREFTWHMLSRRFPSESFSVVMRDARPSQGVLSPDGQTLAIAVQSGVVVLNTRNGEELKRFTTRPIVGSMQFSGDGKRLLTLHTASKTELERGRLRSAAVVELDTWDAIGGDRIETRVVHRNEKDLTGASYAIAPDAPRVAIASLDLLLLRNVQTNESHTAKLPAAIESLLFFDGGQQLLAVTEQDAFVLSAELQVDAARTFDEKILESSLASASSMALLRTASTIVLWDYDRNETEPFSADSALRFADRLDSEIQLLHDRRTNTVSALNTASRRIERSMPGHSEDLRGAASTRDFVATWTSTGEVRGWPASASAADWVEDEFPDTLIGCEFVETADRLVVADSNSFFVRDLQTDEVTRYFPPYRGVLTQILPIEGGEIACVIGSHNTSRIGAFDPIELHWRDVGVLKDWTTKAAAVSSDGQRLLLAGNGPAPQVRQVAIEDGTSQVLWQTDRNDQFIESIVALAPSGHWAIAVARGDSRALLHGKGDAVVAESPLDPAPAPVTEMACSPAGRRLAIATKDQTVLVIDLERKIVAHRLREAGTSVAFFKQRGMLLTSGEHTKLWDAAVGLQATVIDGVRGRVATGPED